MGPLVAKELQREWQDSDRWVENQSQSTIAEIFAKFGEPHFRKLETAAIQAICYGDIKVISLGGGAIVAQENRILLKQAGRCVWLQASLEVMQDRIARDVTQAKSRPPLTASVGYDELSELLAKRSSIYQEMASWTVDTTGKSPEETAVAIASWWKSLA